MERRLELDAARGLMLVWMALTHLPTVVTPYVNQPFGFISASEGFIFLSALFTGRIYLRLALRSGYPAMRRKLLARTFRLYLYHALLLAFTFVVAVPIASRSNRPGLHNLLNFYFVAGPRRAIVEAFLLVYRPPLLDILPMYIIFLLLTPIVLILARRFGWTPILSASLTLWLLAQLGLSQALYGLAQHFGVRIPLAELGSFDLWAWQLCWAAGLYCGVRWAQGNWRVEKFAARAAFPAAFFVLLFLALRYAVSAGMDLGKFEPLFDKWHFGIVRIVDFTAISALLIRFQSRMKSLAFRPLILLGQASLQVFCVHLLFCFAGLTLMGSAAMLKGWQQAALLVATFSAMLLTARLFAKTEAPAPGKFALVPHKAPHPAVQASASPGKAVASAK